MGHRSGEEIEKGEEKLLSNYMHVTVFYQSFVYSIQFRWLHLLFVYGQKSIHKSTVDVRRSGPLESAWIPTRTLGKVLYLDLCRSTTQPFDIKNSPKHLRCWAKNVPVGIVRSPIQMKLYVWVTLTVDEFGPVLSKFRGGYVDPGGLFIGGQFRWRGDTWLTDIGGKLFTARLGLGTSNKKLKTTSVACEQTSLSKPLCRTWHLYQ